MAGESYTFAFYAARFQSLKNRDFTPNSFDVAVFGYRDCSAIPFGNPANHVGDGCPANYNGRHLLGAASVYSKNAWVQGKFTLTRPEDINVIAIGPGCAINPVDFAVIQTILTTETTKFIF